MGTGAEQRGHGMKAAGETTRLVGDTEIFQCCKNKLIAQGSSSLGTIVKWEVPLSKLRSSVGHDSKPKVRTRKLRNCGMLSEQRQLWTSSLGRLDSGYTEIALILSRKQELIFTPSHTLRVRTHQIKSPVHLNMIFFLTKHIKA